MATARRLTSPIELAFGPYTFAAVRAELSDESAGLLNGGTHEVTVRLYLRSRGWRSVDTALVHMSINKVIAPFRERMLVAEHPTAGRCLVGDRQVTLEAGTTRYHPHRDQVVLLPRENTTIDTLADDLLDRVHRELSGLTGLFQVKLTLADAPLLAVTVSRYLHDDDRSDVPPSSPPNSYVRGTDRPCG